MASISFDDGSGSQTISSSYPAPANRFRGWRPNPQGIGERATRLADGGMVRYKHRTDYGAHLELHGIARSEDAKLQAFKEWADDGGAFTVTTADSESNTYTTCKLKSGTFVELIPDLVRKKVFTLSLDFINAAVTPVPARCIYT